MRKTAIITDIAIQAYSWFTESLLKNDYIVHCIKRCAISFNVHLLDYIFEDCHIESPHFCLHLNYSTHAGNQMHSVQETPQSKTKLFCMHNQNSLYIMTVGWYTNSEFAFATLGS